MSLVRKDFLADNSIIFIPFSEKALLGRVDFFFTKKMWIFDMTTKEQFTLRKSEIKSSYIQYTDPGKSLH